MQVCWYQLLPDGTHLLIRSLNLVNLTTVWYTTSDLSISLVVPTLYDTPNPYSTWCWILFHLIITCVDLVLDTFAFTYDGAQYTYTRLSQGFIDKPSIFNSVLREQLSALSLPQGVLILQYVDDILLAAPDSESITTATEMLLQHLTQCDYKMSKSKLQTGQTRVTFLGCVIPPPACVLQLHTKKTS